MNDPPLDVKPVRFRDMSFEEKRSWLKKFDDMPEPEGCVCCGAIAGCCTDYPNCPGNPEWMKQQAVTFVSELQQKPWWLRLRQGYIAWRKGMLRRFSICDVCGWKAIERPSTMCTDCDPEGEYR